MEEGQQQRTTQYTVSNHPYVSESALQMRLDTTKLLEEIQMYLEGKEWQVQTNDNGDQVPVKIQSPNSSPKANAEGVNSLMFRIRSLMNQATVQGNFTEDLFKDRLSEMRRSLARDLIINSQRWNIKEEDLFLICDGIMDTMWAFMSRLINNEERKGLNPSQKQEQNSEVMYPGGVLRR
ncbi:MAG: hypothetical protein ACLFTR_03460 [Candidatus Woesearchaeota archaeon]